MQNGTIGKLAAIGCLILLSIGILAAWNSPATAFETSIYKSTPSLFWVGIGFCIAAGIIGIISHIAANEEGSESMFPLVPFLLIFSGFASILSLFILRGYTLWASGDPLTHLGMTESILATGHVEKINYYPITHVFLTQINEITGISIYTLSKIIPWFFALLGVSFAYCLAKAVLPDKRQIVLSTILSMTLLGGWYLDLTPNILGNFIFPLVLYIIVKSLSAQEIQWRFLALVWIFVFPMFHIVPAFVILLILISIPIANRLFANREDRSSQNYKKISRFSISSSIFLFVWSIAWISSFAIWDYQISNIYDLLAGYRQSALSSLISDINYAAGYNYSVLGVFIKTYGGLAILIILSFITIIILWLKGALNRDYKLLSLFIVPLVVVSGAVMSLYFFNLDFPPIRMLVYIQILCNLFVPVIILKVIRPQNSSFSENRISLAPVAVSLVIVVLFTLGSLVLYPSRYTYEVSNQITQTELNGMNWFLHNNDTKKNHTFLSEIVYRFGDLFLTPEERSTRTDIYYSRARRLEYKIPYRFGYDQNDNLGSYYSQDLYMVLNQLDKDIYVDVYPEMANIRFEPEDFGRLENDFSLDKLYTDTGFDAYYLHGTKPK